jgi:hypothetical protein
MTDAELFRSFQSLGDNCEYAAAQEQAGLKRPLTLLSYANCRPGLLQAAMETRFAEVGDPVRTRLTWWYPWSEYKLVAAPYFSLHARLFRPFASDTEQVTATLGCAALLRLLRRRLLDDMADPCRIFVFKTADRAFGAEQAERMHAALRALGPARLLCVTLAPSADRVGHVEDRGDGLYVGWIDRFGRFPAHRPWIGSFDVWRALCLQARTLHSVSLVA